jgi:hypothetical protein
MLIFQEKHSVKGIVSEEDYLVLEKYTETYFKEELKCGKPRIDSSGH